MSPTSAPSAWWREWEVLLLLALVFGGYFFAMALHLQLGLHGLGAEFLV